MKPLTLVVLICLSQALAQDNNVLIISSSSRVTAKAGASVDAALSVTVAQGYHANSNQPIDPFLIPLRLTWGAGPLRTKDVVFPKPQIQKLGFSAKPVSVLTGQFSIVTHFEVSADAAPGLSTLTGKLHFQACDDRSCLPPRTLEVSLPVEIVK